MRTCACAFFILCFYAWPVSADAPAVDQLLAAGQAQAEKQQFDEALRSLARAAALDPDNVEVKLAVTRVHSWQGRYDQAEQELKALSAANPDNADIRSAAAYLDYYRGRNEAAAAEFASIVQTYPDETDAVDGLKLAKDAEKGAAGFDWQFDAGYEHSDFARQPQTPWSNEFVQITRLFDGGATAVHGRFEYYDEFQTTDVYYEIGADHRFEPWFNAYLYGGHTVDASFRPRWRVEPGGNLRLNEESESAPAVWLTLDVKEDDYGSPQIATIDPGARFEYRDWALSPNLVQVEQWGLTSIWGYNLRLDGPIEDGLRFYVGYADAPETENAVTVYTATAYGGFSYEVSDAYAISLGYTHDDRQNSWIRHVVDLALTYRL